MTTVTVRYSDSTTSAKFSGGIVSDTQESSATQNRSNQTGSPAGLGPAMSVVIKVASSAIEPYKHGIWTSSSSSGIPVRAVVHAPSVQYDAIAKAIEGMANEDQDEPSYIDEKAKAYGLWLTDLFRLTNILPPRIFSHGGDSLVFTWRTPDTKKYLTPMEGCGLLREYSLAADQGLLRSLDFQLDNHQSVVSLLEEIGGKRWTVKQI